MFTGGKTAALRYNSFKYCFQVLLAPMLIVLLARLCAKYLLISMLYPILCGNISLFARAIVVAKDSRRVKISFLVV